MADVAEARSSFSLFLVFASVVMSLSQMLFYASSFSIYRKNDIRPYRLFIEWIIVVDGHRRHKVCKILFSKETI